jgi:hypothetical protein
VFGVGNGRFSPDCAVANNPANDFAALNAGLLTLMKCVAWLLELLSRPGGAEDPLIEALRAISHACSNGGPLRDGEFRHLDLRLGRTRW